MNRLRVVIAEDNPALLRQLLHLLTPEFDVVATAENGLLALKHIRQHHPDVAVLDLQMPILSGIEVAQQLKRQPPMPAVVICSVEIEPETVEAAQQAGALGYVFKIRMVRDLIPAIRATARGEVSLPPLS